MKFTRITVNPKQMDGMPCIRGLRIPVATVVGLVAEGMTHARILKAYPNLKAADINEALQFAAEAVRERELPLTAR
jgi:uncharacterized protein (DUF433 family)